MLKKLLVIAAVAASFNVNAKEATHGAMQARCAQFAFGAGMSDTTVQKHIDRAFQSMTEVEVRYQQGIATGLALAYMDGLKTYKGKTSTEKQWHKHLYNMHCGS